MAPSFDLFAASIPSEPDVKTVAQKESAQTQTLFAVVKKSFQFLSSQDSFAVFESFDEPVEDADESLELPRRERRRLVDSLRSLSRVLTTLRAVVLSAELSLGYACNAHNEPLVTMVY